MIAEAMIKSREEKLGSGAGKGAAAAGARGGDDFGGGLDGDLDY